MLRDEDLLPGPRGADLQTEVAKACDVRELVDREQAVVECGVGFQQGGATHFRHRRCGPAATLRRLMVEPDLRGGDPCGAVEAVIVGEEPVVAAHPPRGAQRASTDQQSCHRPGCVVRLAVIACQARDRLQVTGAADRARHCGRALRGAGRSGPGNLVKGQPFVIVRDLHAAMAVPRLLRRAGQAQDGGVAVDGHRTEPGATVLIQGGVHRVGIPRLAAVTVDFGSVRAGNLKRYPPRQIELAQMDLDVGGILCRHDDGRGFTRIAPRRGHQPQVRRAGDSCDKRLSCAGSHGKR